MVKQIEPINDKFVESFELDEWEVETEDGWKDITHFHKTIEYDVWEIKTKDYYLKCADDHLVIDHNFRPKKVKNLKIGDKIITKRGLQKITSVRKLDCEKQNMYDVTVDSKNHTLFINGILSHNTTTFSIYMLHYVLFNKDKTVAILAHQEKLAIEILDRIKTGFKNLPLWLQVGITEGGWNQKSIVLENGSRIYAFATGSESITGFTVNLLYLDEFAKVPAHIAEEFIASTYPVISSGKTSKIIMVSTPKGMNLFYEFWSNAIRNKNNFYPIRVGWWELPGRDEEWKRKTISDIGQKRFDQEFSCLNGNSLVNIKNKKTNLIERVKIKELFENNNYK